MKRHLFALFFIFLTNASFSSDAEIARIRQEFSKAYENKRFDLAIVKAEHLIRLGDRSAENYYNLGNAAYRSGDLAKAILNYERAIRIAPNDEDIRFNLNIANRQKTDKIDALPQLPFNRLWRGYLKLFSPQQWTFVLMLSLWMLALSLAVYFFTGRVKIKRNAFLCSTGLLVICTLIFAGTYSSYQDLNNSREAILVKPRAEVRSAPDSGSDRLFLLHEGTKVGVEEQLREWTKIRLPNGNIGWIPASEIELI